MCDPELMLVSSAVQCNFPVDILRFTGQISRQFPDFANWRKLRYMYSAEQQISTGDCWPGDPCFRIIWALQGSSEAVMIADWATLLKQEHSYFCDIYSVYCLLFIVCYLYQQNAHTHTYTHTHIYSLVWSYCSTLSFMGDETEQLDIFLTEFRCLR